MKLEFITEKSACLCPVLRETRTASETAEAILPDSCPDGTEVLFVSGTAFLRGQELTEGQLNLSLGVSAFALVETQGERAPEVAEVYLPMSLKIENQGLRPGMRVCVRVSLSQLEGQLMSPRKVMVRAGAAAEISVYTQCVREHISETAEKDVYMLRRTAAVRCLKAMGEKRYTVEDTVPLHAEGEALRIGGFQVSLRHTDARLTGTRAVLRGEAALNILYFDREGGAKTGSASLPFSQYVDLDDCRETDELELTSVLSGADVALSVDGSSANVTLQIITTAQVWAREEYSYAADLYSLRGEVVPEIGETACESLLDRQYFSAVGHGTAAAQRVVYSVCLPGEGNCQRDGEQVSLRQPVSVRLLWEDGEGKLHGAHVRTELTARSQAAEDCRFSLETTELQADCAPGGEGVDVKVTGTLAASFFGTETIHEILGAELREGEKRPKGPGIVIRRAGPGESLWSIAKSLGTTQEAILAANGLEPGAVPQGLLLIPRT